MTRPAAPRDPVAAFDLTVATMITEDWTGVARLCDPTSLRVFRRQIIEDYDPATPVPTFTVEGILQSAPQIPRAEAERMVSMHRMAFDRVANLRRELPGVESVAALRAMAPVEAFATWLDAKSYRRQLTEMAARGEISEAEARAPTPAGLMSYRALGAVLDGDRFATVVYRRAF